MRPVACAAAAAAAFLLVAAKAPEERPIAFKVTPAPAADGKASLLVEMRFRGDSDAETVLHLPSAWAGSSELWRHIEGLEIRGAERLSGFYDNPVIHHRPGARLKVRYRVVSAWEEDPGFAYEQARPLVRGDSFFVHGEGLFAAPNDRQAKPARFRWGKLPKGWTVASDLDHLGGKPTSLANLVNSVAIGGADLKLVRRSLSGAPLRVAVLGDWAFTPEEFADSVAPIVAAEDAFWGDPSSPYLVALAPTGTVPSGLSYTGLGRTDGFSVASTSAFDLKIARRFLAHEIMHSWLPNELGEMPAGEREAEDFWFSEGFSDYLAAKVLVRSGLWTLADYVSDYNEALLRYGTSPARDLPAAQVAARFWSDLDVRQLSYDRGRLIAARLDAQIAARTDGRRSLDDVLRAQRGAAAGSTGLATSLFLDALRAETGIDAAADIERHARAGEPVTLPAGLFGDCAAIVTERRREFHRGYDAQATREAGGVIAGVIADGPAFRAGMRDGMRLVRREAGKMGDSTVEIAYRVADAEGEKVLRYMPEGPAEFEVQQLRLTAEGPGAETACRARLGGRAG